MHIIERILRAISLAIGTKGNGDDIMTKLGSLNTGADAVKTAAAANTIAVGLLEDDVETLETAVEALTAALNSGMSPAATSQNIDGTSASAATAAVFSETLPTFVRIVCNEGSVHYVVDTTPVATSSNVVLPVGYVEIIKVPANKKIAVLGGVLNITVMS